MFIALYTDVKLIEFKKIGNDETFKVRFDEIINFIKYYKSQLYETFKYMVEDFEENARRINFIVEKVEIPEIFQNDYTRKQILEDIEEITNHKKPHFRLARKCRSLDNYIDYLNKNKRLILTRLLKANPYNCIFLSCEENEN